MNAKGSDVRGNPHMVREQFLSYKDIHGVMRASADLVRPVPPSAPGPELQRHIVTGYLAT